MSTRSITKPQRDKVAQFQSITGEDNETALECLRLANWAVEPAIDYYFSAGLQNRSKKSRIDRNALNQFYLRYKDSDHDAILAEGIIKLCEDLGIDPEDLVMLVLSYHLNAAAMGEFTKQEFESGMESLQVDSLDKLKAKIPQLRAELENPESFKEIYNYAYLFSREKGQKCLQLDTALAMWQLLVIPSKWPHIGDWCEYLEEYHKRAVSKDTWSQLLDFMRNVNTDFSNYDENGAWPYLIDEFVAYKKEKMNGNA